MTDDKQDVCDYPGDFVKKHFRDKINLEAAQLRELQRPRRRLGVVGIAACFVMCFAMGGWAQRLLEEHRQLPPDSARRLVILEDEAALAWFLDAPASDLSAYTGVVIGAGHLLQGSRPVRDATGDLVFRYASPGLVDQVAARGRANGLRVYSHIHLDRTWAPVDDSVWSAYELQEAKRFRGSLLEVTRLQ
jgi:hypothetical protein